MAWCCWDVEQDIGAQGAKKLLQQNFDARFSRCCSVSVINYFSDSPDPLNHVRSCVFSRMFKSWWSCLMMLMNSSCWDIWAMFNDVWQGNIWRKCLNFRFWMLVCKDLHWQAVYWPIHVLHIVVLSIVKHCLHVWSWLISPSEFSSSLRNSSSAFTLSSVDRSPTTSYTALSVLHRLTLVQNSYLCRLLSKMDQNLNILALGKR